MKTPQAVGTPLSLQGLRHAVELAADGFVLVDARGRVQWANRAALAMVGSALEGSTVEDWPSRCGFHSGENEPLADPEALPVVEALRERRQAEGELLIRRPDRPDPVWLHMTAAPLPEGGAVVTLREITRLRQAQQELHDRLQDLTRAYQFCLRLSSGLDVETLSGEVLRAAMELAEASMGSLMLLEDGALRATAHVGVPAEYLECWRHLPGAACPCGFTVSLRRTIEVSDVERQEPERNFCEAARLGGYRAFLSLPLLTAAGAAKGALVLFYREPHQIPEARLRVLELYARYAAQSLENAQLFRDAHAAAAQLRKLSQAVERSSVAIVITDAAGNIEYVNPKFTELTGYQPHEVRGKNPRILRSGRTPPEVYRELWNTILAGRDWRGEFLNRKKTGELYWESASISPVAAPDGTITHFIAVKEDITGRKLFEEALEQTNLMLSTIIETSPLAICTLDGQGCVTSWNPAAERILGWRREEVLGRPLPLIPQNQIPEFYNLMEAVRQGQALRGLERRGERKDGAPVELAIWGAPLRDAKGLTTGVLLILADVTERKTLEEQLRQAQKMEAIGRLAGGVAHDFNNLLTVITGYGELLLSQLDGPARDDLEAIMEAAQRATALTRQLLALSRRQISQPRIVDLNAVIRGMERLLRRALGEDVTLELSLVPALWPVKADPAQLEQVLLNLAVNARDAMPRGGRLIIATANAKAAECAAVRLPQGQYVRLTVRDTGEGMDPEACQRIFEPFFSTKPQKGTGLGLAIVYGIVKQSGGDIFVDSQRGEGTVFTIYWPRVKGTPEVAAPRRPTVPAAANREVILLVEDEDAVRRLVRDTLVRHGYTVLEAADGPQALEIFEKHGQRVDLVLTDVVMPRMSGRELALRLTAQRPDLKIMYMSGYTGDVIADHGVLEPGVLLLPKPFSGPLLLRRLREALEGRGNSK